MNYIQIIARAQGGRMRSLAMLGVRTTRVDLRSPKAQSETPQKTEAQTPNF